ncbi:nitroreductase family protein [Hydrogenimonas sp.]
MNDCSGREYHEATKHSWLSVRQNPHRLDWENQPASMKFYPEDLPRVKLSKAYQAHTFVYHIGGITAKKSYPGVEYYLRTNPSAGALYPNELYFQARGVEGFGDGIYHFEVGSSSAVRLCGIGEEEGIEPLLGLRHGMRGLLFMVSAVWYRSAWKYRDRAFRYCLLDAGHILGAIEAGAYLYGHAWRIAYGIDLEGLGRFFGFGEEEWFLAAAICAVPKRDRSVKIPGVSMPRTDPLGGVEAEPYPLIARTYRETMRLRGCKKEPRFPAFFFHEAAWEEAIQRRRSIREFSKKPISKAQFEAIMEIVNLPVPSDCDEPLAIYAILNRVSDVPIGIYYNGRLVKSGDFAQKAGYLCLEQRLGSESAVTFFILGRGCNYRALCQKAGLLGHRIYLVSEYLGLGCSGIGAYYDDEVREFLEDDGMVLYALAVGV